MDQEPSFISQIHTRGNAATGLPQEDLAYRSSMGGSVSSGRNGSESRRQEKRASSTKTRIITRRCHIGILVLAACASLYQSLGQVPSLASLGGESNPPPLEVDALGNRNDTETRTVHAHTIESTNTRHPPPPMDLLSGVPSVPGDARPQDMTDEEMHDFLQTEGVDSSTENQHYASTRLKDDVIRSESIKDQVSRYVSAVDSCSGKEALLKILVAAGVEERPGVICPHLPTTQEQHDLYGSELVIHGLDTCQTYRDKIQAAGLAKPLIRVAGLWNTGTNSLTYSIRDNLYDDIHVSDEQAGIQYRVAWGKHNPVADKYEHTMEGNQGDDKELILPVVLVRDPYQWMNSMCRASYDARFRRGRSCPTLLRLQTGGKYVDNTVMVMYEGSGLAEKYSNLADLWSTWNRAYLEADFPRLVIRFEDFLFHAEKVMQVIGECAGIAKEEGATFVYQTKAAKNHGDSSNLLSAVAKYGSEQGRYGKMQAKDVQRSKTALAPDLMESFGYRYAPDNFEDFAPDISRIVSAQNVLQPRTVTRYRERIRRGDRPSLVHRTGYTRSRVKPSVP